MYKIKNISESPRKFYNSQSGKWIVLKSQEEIEVEFKPQEHSAFEITQSNKKDKVQNNITEEGSSDNKQ